jgi:predicted AlkP superfamily phosphohydrolase/phosphomutase
MSLLQRLFGAKPKKVCVIGIDGVPYTYFEKLLAEGQLPHFGQLVQEGGFRRMNSVHPTVSSVAWSSFMTGQNPAKHNIFGFVDRQPGSYDVFIPTSKNMASRTLWEILSDAGKRVVVINVPVTYPPRQVNGVLIGCFLCTDINKVAYPPTVTAKLKELNYRIDIDAQQARQSKDKLLDDLHATLDGRIAAAHHFLAAENWDYFQVHIMGTDRINHFLWGEQEAGDPKYGPEFLRYYQRVDAFLGDMADRLKPKDCELVILSDHGFCTIRQEVFLNVYLAGKGWVKFTSDAPKGLTDLHPESRAYSLIPGRVFVHRQGREPNGCIAPEDYERVREELRADLLEMKDPATGQAILRDVVKREEIYAGPHFDRAADLIAIPHDGYDLKGNVNAPALTGRSEMTGMHTYHDALLYVRGRELTQGDGWVADVMPTILQMMGVPVPGDVDGRSLLVG